jgi:transposase
MGHFLVERQYFIGIDVSKDSFEVALQTNDAQRAAESGMQPQKRDSFSNDETGIRNFLETFCKQLPHAFVVLEATGKYEHYLLCSLLRTGVHTHRASGYQTSSFIRSLRPHSKTDRSDAMALAIYAKERHSHLQPAILPSENQEKLEALISRRRDVVAMKVAEQQRVGHPRYGVVRDRVQKVLEFLSEELLEINEEIELLILDDADKGARMKVMESVTGIGRQTALTLLAAMPELGTLTRRQVASLAGVAPHPKDSGKHQGYRATRGGRDEVKRALFLAALAASRGKSDIAAFYRRLIENGKKPIVALIATARKIIIIVNARLRDAYIIQPCTS